jgi:hypothetical protein
VIPSSGPRSDHHLLGSNLSDEEFKILLDVVGTSHDGKISLSEFDLIAKCSLITSTSGIKSGSSNNENDQNKRDVNGLSASNSTYECPNRNLEFDVLDYEKFDKNHKIDRDKVREIRRNSARNHAMYNTDQDEKTSPRPSNAAMCQHQYQSIERPHQMLRGRDQVPDNRARRSYSFNSLGSPRPSRTQGSQGSSRQGEIILIGSFEDERKVFSDVMYHITLS